MRFWPSAAPRLVKENRQSISPSSGLGNKYYYRGLPEALRAREGHLNVTVQQVTECRLEEASLEPILKGELESAGRKMAVVRGRTPEFCIHNVTHVTLH